MKYTEYIPLTVAIADVLDTVGEDQINLRSIEKWAGKAMEKVYVAETYEPKVHFVEVNNYKACLPKGIRWVYQILFKNELIDSDVNEITVFVDTCPECGIQRESVWNFINSPYANVWIPATPVGSPFALSVHCENSPSLLCSSAINYNVTPDGTITVNSEKGILAIAGLYFPVNEGGEFLIPNEETIIDAIRLYCLMKIWETRWNSAEEGAQQVFQRYQHYLARWEIAAARAKGESKMPSIGELENLKNQWMRLGPHKNTFWSAFGNLNTPEHLVFDNSKFN